MSGFTDLTPLFDPRSVALVGASERAASVGGRTLSNILDHSDYRGALHLVNATRPEIRGLPCHRRVADLPEVPDLAVVAVPAAGVMEALRDCAALGVRICVILSSGFGETGEAGRAVEAEMAALARETGMRLYGPNCPGVTNINRRLGFTFSPAFKDDLRPGPIGLATQGGGLGRNLLQSMARGTGFALWCSTGNEVDLQVADFIHYMAGAPDVTVIGTILEGIKDGPRFLAAARAAAEAGKPVVALKVGRSAYGMRAAASHTASLTGSAEVNSAAFRQLGILEVDDVDELVDVASLLARARGRPHGGERIAVFGSSGGACALAADMVGQAGLVLAELASETTAALAAELSPFAALGNPVDTTTVTLTNPAVIETTLAAVANDPAVSLVMLPMPLDYGPVSLAVAERMVAAQARTPVPLVPVWMSERTGPAYHAFAEAGMVPMRSLRNAALAFRRFVDHGTRQPGLMPPGLGAGPAGGATRTLLEAEGKALLREAGLAVPEGVLARTAEEAGAAATRLGFPVAVKVASAAILHKSDIGGVALGLRDAAAAEAAFAAVTEAAARHHPDARIDGALVERMAAPGGAEMILSVSRDPVLGQVMTVGLGGLYVELLRDAARRLLPVDADEAGRMLRELRGFPLLAGARGAAPLDLGALAGAVAALSALVEARPGDFEEIEINPLRVGAEGGGAWVLDAVVTLREGETP
ncbi:6-carboxyhexanoate--CoA ligase (plasmid) [Roseomonas mucosa]|uniref:6-carboxyhexanoate--CoA ligase n=1 Tax=Roseomonas mucosa TaxID=207340 RepID=A0A4Y1MR70_9PROT|nr:acetate--CoA ligase family protein [Roseomonas mucosa]AWV20485.1 6-carboxyhexanoate--CoA ligase [Roseomonas mucosa]MDT8356150.1 acetate--CoA ligase family protein [Roseomonas mucosa]